MYIGYYNINMEQQHNEDCKTDMEIDYNEEQMLIDDEEYARKLQQEYIKEALLEQQQEEEHRRELRRLENEENARIRLQQDMEYLECLNVIPKNNITFQNNEYIPPPPPIPHPITHNEPEPDKLPEPENIKPPQHFICPISNKIIDIPIRDIEDNIYYDKKSLLQYLKENNNKNHNGKIIDKQNLITDNNLKTEIFLWLREHPEYNNFQ
jgi:hypothetical protein